MMRHGLRPGEIIADGKRRRCPVEGGKPGKKDGSYRLLPEQPPRGHFKNFKTGDSGGWRPAGAFSTLSPQERAEIKSRDAQREKEQKAKWAKTATKAQEILTKAMPCPAEHPYLVRKGVRPCRGLRVDRWGRLLVPVYGPDGEVQTLQTIDARGNKRFLKGGKKAGGSFVISDAEGPIYVCEGLATGLTIHEAIGGRVVVAFDAGNLEAVSVGLRERKPDARIIICADNDGPKGNNPGLTNAIKAARAAKGYITMPTLQDPKEKVDFNDLQQEIGLDAVREQLQDVSEPGPEPADDNDGDASSGKKEKKQRQSQSEILLDLAGDAELLHSQNMEPFARVKVNDHRETHPIQSNGFQQWLRGAFFWATGKAPTDQAMKEALATLEARARFTGDMMPVFIRVGHHGGNVYLDLGNENWDVVKMAPDGWSVDPDPPVAFFRPVSQKALPMPQKALPEDLLQLGEIVNLGSQENLILAIAWLVGSLNPNGAYAMLVLQGEQGSGKSTTAKVLQQIVDPCIGMGRSTPRTEQDLMVAATNGWVLGFDNLSYISADDSDALCRIATGGAFASRKLYTGREEEILEAARPVILNGIAISQRPDLADRCIILTLPAMSPDLRRTENELEDRLREARPRLLGALLSAVSASLANKDKTLERLPRMADFYLWVCRAEEALPWEAGSFEEAYEKNRAMVVENSLEGDPVASAVLELMRDRSEWQGTASELLDALSEIATEATVRSRAWPKAGNTLSSRLMRGATFLRELGIEITKGRDKTQRNIIIKKENTVTGVTGDKAEQIQPVVGDGVDDGMLDFSRHPKNEQKTVR